MNIKTVAQRAKVSIATVSRTINESGKVSPKTAERVRRAIAELQFYPNSNARSLGSGRSSLYGLIVSDITNPFFPELVKSFEDIAAAHGQEVLIANTNYDPERMKHCVTRMLQRKVDGVAVMTSEMDDKLIEVFSRRDVPLVFMDYGKSGPGMSCTRIDYSAGIEMAMQHLTSLGHSRIAFISGPLRLASARIRYQAYMDSTLREHLDADPNLIQEGTHGVEGGKAAMERIFASGTRPTAVLGSNDLTAIGAMGAIFDRGLRIPQDISVIGYDDIQLSAYTMPPLTTVALPRVEIANAAFRALFTARGIDGNGRAQGQEQAFHPKFVIRKSTGPAPSEVESSAAVFEGDAI